MYLENAPSYIQVSDEDTEFCVKHTYELSQAYNYLFYADCTVEEIEASLRDVLANYPEIKLKNLFASVRIAITGSRISPPLFESMFHLGRKRTLSRILNAALQGQPPSVPSIPTTFDCVAEAEIMKVEV